MISPQSRIQKKNSFELSIKFTINMNKFYGDVIITEPLKLTSQ
jgi:hypothetical protein